MNRINFALLAVVAMLVVPGAAQAQKKIYSWTDADGVTHYSDRAPDLEDTPSENVSETDMPAPPPVTVPALATPVTDEAAAEDAADTVTVAESADEELSYADQQRQALQERRLAEQEKTAERRKLCLQATEALARVEPNRRVFYTDESGQSVRMDDDERIRMVEEAKALKAANCD